MANLWLVLISSVWINIDAYDDSNCTYLQAKLTQGSESYLVAYVPYVCMSFGRTHVTDKRGWHTHIDKSGMFSCQSNGELRYDEYSDGVCEDNNPSSTTNLNTGNDVKVGDDTVTIRDFRCDDSSENAVCEFLLSRIELYDEASCSGEGPLYDEVYIVDKCLPTLTGKYQVISCSWYEATRSVFDDEDCTQNGQGEVYLDNDYYEDSCSSEACRDLNIYSCRRNFTLCSNGGSNPFNYWCDEGWPVAQEFLCQSVGRRTRHCCGVLVLILIIVLFLFLIV